MNLIISKISNNNFNEQKRQNLFKTFQFGLNGNNLAPLRADKVSFTGGNEKLLTTKVKNVSFSLAQKVHNEAGQHYKDLRYVLKRYLKSLVAVENNPMGTISEIKGRAKDPFSICEKASSRYIDNYTGLKKMGDVVGARIVMRDGSQKNVDEVIGKLTEAVVKGDLKIREIENYRLKSSQSYVSQKAMDKMINASEKKGFFITKTEKAIPSGYSALHLTVELPNNFLGEIQIMGRDIESLKEVEDFCYKVRNGKQLKPKYKIIYDKIKPAMDSIKKDEDKAIYLKYLQDSYQFARNLTPKRFKEKNIHEFIPIPYFLPKELDFTYLDAMKKRCDIEAKAKALKH